MANGAEHDLGLVDSFEAESIGEPGDRRFRLRLMASGETASLWIEKEQVQALANAIEQVLVLHRKDRDGSRPPAAGLADFPRHPTHDFRVSRLALAYDDGGEALAIYATDAAAGDQERATLRASFSRELARRFSRQAQDAVAAGRPLCPLCKEPLDPGEHLCPPANGHAEDAITWLGPPEL